MPWKFTFIVLAFLASCGKPDAVPVAKSGATAPADIADETPEKIDIPADAFNMGEQNGVRSFAIGTDIVYVDSQDRPATGVWMSEGPDLMISEFDKGRRDGVEVFRCSSHTRVSHWKNGRKHGRERIYNTYGVSDETFWVKGVVQKRKKP